MWGMVLTRCTPSSSESMRTATDVSLVRARVYSRSLCSRQSAVFMRGTDGTSARAMGWYVTSWSTTTGVACGGDAAGGALRTVPDVATFAADSATSGALDDVAAKGGGNTIPHGAPMSGCPSAAILEGVINGVGAAGRSGTSSGGMMGRSGAHVAHAPAMHYPCHMPAWLAARLGTQVNGPCLCDVRRTRYG